MSNASCTSVNDANITKTTTFNFCFQNSNDISDNLSQAYKEFKTKQISTSDVSSDLTLNKAVVQTISS